MTQLRGNEPMLGLKIESMKGLTMQATWMVKIVDTEMFIDLST